MLLSLQAQRIDIGEHLLPRFRACHYAKGRRRLL